MGREQKIAARPSHCYDTCSVCGDHVSVGEEAYWDLGTKEVWHDRHGPDGCRVCQRTEQFRLAKILGMP